MTMTQHQASSPFFTCPHFAATFSLTPITPYHISILLPSPLHTLDRVDFQSTFLAIRKLVAELNALPFPPPAAVERFGLASDGGDIISLIPFHGIDLTAEWKPFQMDADESVEVRRGRSYLSSCPSNSIRVTKEHLVKVMNIIRRISGLEQNDVSNHIDESSPYDETNLFARLIHQELPVYRIREDYTHVAWLTPFESTVGSSVVVPRRHYTSNVLGMTDEQGGDEAFVSFVGFAWDVARDEVEAFKGQGVERCGFFMEGYHINWAHIKIMPVWPTTSEADGVEEFSEVYKGYLTTQKGSKVTDEQELLLETTARELEEKLEMSW